MAARKRDIWIGVKAYPPRAILVNQNSGETLTSCQKVLMNDQGTLTCCVGQAKEHDMSIEEKDIAYIWSFDDV